MTRTAYDVAVIGAGPAGAMAAYRCARAGASVLLVDKQRFPRDKVCGCCINGAAMATLEASGLGDLPARCGARPLQELRVAAGSRTARIPLPDSVCLSRAALDAALVQAAVENGAMFRDGTAAVLGEMKPTHHMVLLAGQHIQAKIVIIATGLGSRLGSKTAPVIHHRIGVSAILDDAPLAYEPGVIHMACGKSGYVGLVRLEDNRLDVAAAMDPAFIKQCGDPGRAVAKILTSCGMPEISLLGDARWHGTPRLNHRRRVVAAPRLFFIGDAAGYVEPFTGEGITWALASGAAVAPLAVQPWRNALMAEWTRRIVMLRRRQGACRCIAAVLRRPVLARLAVGACSIIPSLAGPIVRRINRPLRLENTAAPA